MGGGVLELRSVETERNKLRRTAAVGLVGVIGIGLEVAEEHSGT